MEQISQRERGTEKARDIRRGSERERDRGGGFRVEGLGDRAGVRVKETETERYRVRTPQPSERSVIAPVQTERVGR